MFGRDKRQQQGATPPGKDSEPGSAHFNESMNWEASRGAALERSERRAWRVAGAFGLGFVLAATAIVVMAPLKETVPYVIRVDNATGVPDLVTAMSEKDIGYDEAMDRYWLAQYVRARETYDWYTLQKDYDTVGLLSSANVAKAYGELFTGDGALDKTLGSQVRRTVEIVSVVPNGSGIGTVRFIKTERRADDTGQGTVTRHIATIGYKYRNPSVLRESSRLTNPLAFQVTSYRADPELTTGATR
ncbi:virB8 family protein [Xanthomonas axonopodis]|uniref:virB8 family protein n=1 Tax=Xanthomonas axonopodis TaxID=53413 RepID=UPI0035565235